MSGGSMGADDTMSTSDITTLTEGTATTDVMTGSQSGTLGDATNTAGDATDTAGDATDTAAGEWCRDADGDGFGDPNECESTEVKSPGWVDNDDDCDDGDAFAFPGAASAEVDSRACMRDADDDGWGDANPGPNVIDGADCNDDDESLNPGMLGLTTFSGSTLYGIDLMVPPTSAWDRALATSTDDSIDVDVQSAALVPIRDGNPLTFVYGTMPGGLHSVAYSGCDTAIVNPVETPMTEEYTASTVCGIERGPDGALYAVDESSVLVELDEITGTLVRTMPILDSNGAPITITDCGLAFDCGQGRLLFANAMDRTIYALVPDPPGPGAIATATDLRSLDDELPGPWTTVGLEWDPVDRMAILSTGTALHVVDVDDDDVLPVTLGSLPYPATNLQFLPNSCQ